MRQDRLEETPQLLPRRFHQPRLHRVNKPVVDEFVPADVDTLARFTALIESSEGSERLAAMMEDMRVPLEGSLPAWMIYPFASGIVTFGGAVDAVARPLNDRTF